MDAVPVVAFVVGRVGLSAGRGQRGGVLESASKEVWVIPLFMLSTLVAMRYLKDITAPRWVRYINQYSFGIYLVVPRCFLPLPMCW